MPVIPWLSILWCLPLVGALVLAILPKPTGPTPPGTRDRRTSIARGFALLVSLATFAIAVYLFVSYQRVAGGAQFIERHAWIPSIGASYHLALDGLNLPLVMLTALIGLLAIASSFRNVASHDHAFHAMLLAFQAGAFGIFLSQDLLLFVIFWELALVPLFFVVGSFGTREERVPAAIQFAMVAATSAAVLLLGVVGFVGNAYRATGVMTFDLATLSSGIGVPSTAGAWLLAALVVGFAIRAAAFPLHGWYTTLLAEAPTGAGVAISGLAMPMAAYGLVRYGVALAPEAWLSISPWVVGVAAVGMLYGACLGMASQDMRKRVAYAATSQFGVVLIAIAAVDARSLEGAILFSIHAAVLYAALLVLIGTIVERLQTHQLGAVGGLGREAPRFAALFGLATMLLIGIPGSGGFASEILLFQGLFARHPLWAVLAALGTVFVAVYMLILLRGVVLGPPTKPVQGEGRMRDLTMREVGVVGLLLAANLAIGLYPSAIHQPLESSMAPIAESVQEIRLDRLDETIAEKWENRR